MENGIIVYDKLLNSLALVFTYEESDMRYLLGKLRFSLGEDKELDIMYRAFWDYTRKAYKDEVDENAEFEDL